MSDTPIGAMEQRKDGEYIGRYLNRTIRSMNKNRVLAYLRTIQLQEEGHGDIESVEQALLDYPFPHDAPISVTWQEAPKHVVVREISEPTIENFNLD